MKLNSNLFRRLPSYNGDKKIFYHLHHTSFPTGPMTDKISAIAESYGQKAFVDGLKELIYISRRTNTGSLNVCTLDFYGNIIENGTFRGQTTHGNIVYSPFSSSNGQIADMRRAVAVLLGDNALTKIALSGDESLLKVVLSNRNVVEIMEFATELKAFSEAQNDWEIRSLANKMIEISYKLIEERNKASGVRDDDDLWDF